MKHTVTYPNILQPETSVKLLPAWDGGTVFAWTSSWQPWPSGHHMNTRKHFGSFSQFHLISKHFVHKRSWSNFFKRKQLFCVIQHERKRDKGTSKSCSVSLTRLTFSFWRLLQCSFLLLFGAKKTHGLLTRWVDCVCSLHSLTKWKCFTRYEAIWSDQSAMPPWVLGRSLTV